MCLSFRPVECGWLGSCAEKTLCCQNQMVQSRIRVGPASFHAWQHCCQIQLGSFTMLSRGPVGVAEGCGPTSYLARNGECPEEPHCSTTPSSRANSTSTASISISATTSRVIRFVWLLSFQRLYLELLINAAGYPGIYPQGINLGLIMTALVINYKLELTNIEIPTRRLTKAKNAISNPFEIKLKIRSWKLKWNSEMYTKQHYSG